ncbi:MAG: hypothetical protein KAJ19_00370 [Gammaproteobacteria bacterium]|nr:hypothetical protein [Gammaproteobacteria bacterium]
MKSIAILILAALTSSWVYSAEQPNILFILADDIRNDSVGAGHPIIQTPVLDSPDPLGIAWPGLYCKNCEQELAD